jgi:hypothetical protein
MGQAYQDGGPSSCAAGVAAASLQGQLYHVCHAWPKKKFICIQTVAKLFLMTIATIMSYP